VVPRRLRRGLRVAADLCADGETISRKTFAKTMQRLGLTGICPKQWKTTTIIGHADAYPVDAAKRKCDTGALSQDWAGDITYLRTWEGWVYLATVIDAHGHRVIGWAIVDHMRTDLIEDALVMTMTLGGDRPARVNFHRLNLPSMCRNRSLSSPPRTASPGRWDTPGFAGTTPWPRASSRP